MLFLYLLLLKHNIINSCQDDSVQLHTVINLAVKLIVAYLSDFWKIDSFKYVNALSENLISLSLSITSGKIYLHRPMGQIYTL